MVFNLLQLSLTALNGAKYDEEGRNHFAAFHPDDMASAIGCNIPSLVLATNHCVCRTCKVRASPRILSLVPVAAWMTFTVL
jgi:hypothetical protein